MLDPKLIKDQLQLVKDNCALRRVSADQDLDAIIKLIDEKARVMTSLQDIQRQQNENAKEVSKVKDADARAALIQLGKDLKAKAEGFGPKIEQFDRDLREILSRIPNLTHPDAPRAEGAGDRVVRDVGEKPAFDFKPLDHVALVERHKLVDFESAAKVSGASFYYLLGDAVLLELALIQYALGHLLKAGYTPVITPDLARERIMEGTGYIPRGPETQVYRVEGSDLCLIATAEITLAGMFADEILVGDQLPKRYVGISHCFRTEAGAAGRATRGLYRVHQFTKVEMFVFCLPDESERFHQELLKIEEEIFAGLEIPYRVLDIHASDLGGPAYRKYDLEAWMPGRGERGEYGEVTSTSNCTDYQARRLNIRFKQAGQKGTQFVHMLNGTAVACGRAMIAILENHQQKDGSIRVPKALVPFIGKDVIGAK